MKNIVLIGMPASGKSTVGVILAKTLGIGFVDTDLVIQQRENALLQDIINEKGLQCFLDKERDAILSLECENCVVATGGSVVFRDEAMQKLKRNSVIVFIDVPLKNVKCDHCERIYHQRFPSGGIRQRGCDRSKLLGKVQDNVPDADGDRSDP